MMFEDYWGSSAFGCGDRLGDGPAAYAVCVAVLCALVVDQVLGEPPVRWHPVVWIGNALGWAGRQLQRRTKQGGAATEGTRDFKAFCLGAFVWCVGAAAVAAVAAGLQWSLNQWHWLAQGLVMGLLLKPLLAWAMLKDEVRAVELALASSLAAGRERLRTLVSRDPSLLTETQVRESAIETLAENLNDSVVAPLFWFALLGLPGAAVYRFANTADAMWGYPGCYHGQNWRWAGKWAARADDVLSWLPARITAAFLLLVAGTRGAHVAGRLRREARQTPSPNSGWPMAAMALVLDVGLSKPGVYSLNLGGRPVGRPDLQRAIRTASLALGAFVLATLFAALCLAPGAVGVPAAAWIRGSTA